MKYNFLSLFLVTIMGTQTNFTEIDDDHIAHSYKR